MQEKDLNEQETGEVIPQLKYKLDELNKRVQEIEDYLEIPEELKKSDVNENEELEEVDEEENEETSKFGVGFLFSFVSLIGLIFGLLLYKEGSFERKTFIKGWLIGFVVGIIIGLIAGVIYFMILTNEIGKITDAYLSLII